MATEENKSSKLIVGAVFEITLEYDTPCHGSTTLCDEYEKFDSGKKLKHLNAWKKALDRNIQAGQLFVNYVFVDEEDGEAYHFNVIKWLDEYMLKHKLYPEAILKRIIDFKHKT